MRARGGAHPDCLGGSGAKASRGRGGARRGYRKRTEWCRPGGRLGSRCPTPRRAPQKPGLDLCSATKIPAGGPARASPASAPASGASGASLVAAADWPLHFRPRGLQLGSQLGRLGLRPFPSLRRNPHGVEGPGGARVGDPGDWCVEAGVWNVKGRDHPQGIILHRVTQIQQLQNMTQRRQVRY